MNFTDRVMEFSSKLGSQRHINAIRNAFYIMMPLVIVASLFVLINNVILAGSWVPESWLAFKDVGDRVYRGTLSIMAISICAAAAYSLATSYKAEAISAAVVSLACFITLTPGTNYFGTEGSEIALWGVINPADISVSGLFVGFIVAMLATELYIRLNAIKALKIVMPEGIPPAVAKSFSSMIPAMLTITIFAIGGSLLHHLFGLTLATLIINLIQSPMQNLMNSFFGFLIVLVVLQILWGIGLHGFFVLGPIIEPIMLSSVVANLEAFNHGSDIPYIVTKSFYDGFINMGGSGGTIGFIIALIIFSRRADHRTVGKISLVPGLFNINETLIFGLPVIFNPIFIIPFLLVPIVNYSIAYMVTAIGLVAKTTIMIPWTTPPIMGAYLATAGDWRAVVLALLLIVVSVVIYSPFVIVSNKMIEKEG